MHSMLLIPDGIEYQINHSLHDHEFMVLVFERDARLDILTVVHVDATLASIVGLGNEKL